MPTSPFTVAAVIFTQTWHSGGFFDTRSETLWLSHSAIQLSSALRPITPRNIQSPRRAIPTQVQSTITSYRCLDKAGMSSVRGNGWEWIFARHSFVRRLISGGIRKCVMRSGRWFQYTIVIRTYIARGSIFSLTFHRQTVNRKSCLSYHLLHQCLWPSLTLAAHSS